MVFPLSQSHDSWSTAASYPCRELLVCQPSLFKFKWLENRFVVFSTNILEVLPATFFLDFRCWFTIFRLFFKYVWLYHATPGTIKTFKNKCWLIPLEQSNIAKHKNWDLEDAKLFHRPMAMLSLGGSSHELDTWLISMVIISPLRIGLWDPFQVAELYGL